MKTVYEFTFSRKAAPELIEAGINSAIFNAECFFGKPRVRLHGTYYLAPNRRHCIIDVSTEVGEHVAQVFTGIMINTLGEDGFQIKRIEGEAASPGVERRT